ncbi:MAG: hypothetical protein Q8O67_33100 [Deltaproteobacteria bacterium]|nr:hypothetical protein [Deltaproteobacteria bacterium]
MRVLDLVAGGLPRSLNKCRRRADRLEFSTQELERSDSRRFVASCAPPRLDHRCRRRLPLQGWRAANQLRADNATVTTQWPTTMHSNALPEATAAKRHADNEHDDDKNAPTEPNSLSYSGKTSLSGHWLAHQLRPSCAPNSDERD